MIVRIARRTTLATPLAVLMFFPVDAARASEAILNVYVVESDLPTAKLISGGNNLTGELTVDPKGMRFRVPIADTLVTPLLLEVKPVDPDASFFPLRVDAPISWSNRTNVIQLRPAKVTGGPDDVRALYASLVKTSDSNLPVLYNRARAIADKRIATLHGDWSNLHDYDIQAVFKYLEVVRELNKRFIFPADSIDTYSTWLETALAQGGARVDHAVGDAAARGLLDQVSELRGQRFALLWRFVSDNEKPCVRRQPLLKAFHRQFREDLGSEEERQAVAGTMRVPEALMVSAIAQCEAIRLRCSKVINLATARPELEAMIAEIEVVRDVSSDASMKTRLAGDLASLRRLGAELDSGGARTCSDPNLWGE